MQRPDGSSLLTFLANDVELFPILAAAGCRREEHYRTFNLK
jgi:hypothetical protein